MSHSRNSLPAMADRAGSIVDPMYANGTYFAETTKYSADAAFKAADFIHLFRRCMPDLHLDIASYIDVGCGSGDVVARVADGLRACNMPLRTVRAYDVSPHVAQLSKPGVDFIHGDICASHEQVDLITLFDVFEHVPAPIQFLQQVAAHCRLMGLHIPLDDSLNTALRNKFRSKLTEPGHLVFLDQVSALNILAFAGLRVIDYEYTFALGNPAARPTMLSKLAYPFRWALAAIAPWLLSRTLGGASLMVLALTPQRFTRPVPYFAYSRRETL